MAKMNEDKAAMYLVAIVGVVAAVGILVLLMNAGIGSSSDYSGQAIRTMGSSSNTGSTSDSISAPTLGDKCMTCHDNGKCGPPIYDC